MPPKFPVDAPKARVVKAFEMLGFRMVREREHIAMLRENAGGTRTPLTMPNHTRIKGSTLRAIASRERSSCALTRGPEAMDKRDNIKLLDVVALIEDMPASRLSRGQVGTVVETLAPGVFEVEFSDDEGHTYAMAALRAEQLIVLHYEPVTSR